MVKSDPIFSSSFLLDRISISDAAGERQTQRNKKLTSRHSESGNSKEPSPFYRIASLPRRP
jgi:hypothetical protein